MFSANKKVPNYLPDKTTINIPIARGRRFALSDVHGCGKTFIHLVERVLKLRKEDQLFILGDLIDRGKNSILLLDWLIKRKEEGYSVYLLMGNHEQMLLDFYQKNNYYLHKKTLQRNHLESLVDESGTIKPRYMSIFEEMVLYIEIENCFLVHAGFDINYNEDKRENLFSNRYAMLWRRKFKGDLFRTHQKPVVHGHVVHTLDVIKQNLIDISKGIPKATLPIDNGCVYVNIERYRHFDGEVGNLCAVDLQTWELFYTPCLD